MSSMTGRNTRSFTKYLIVSRVLMSAHAGLFYFDGRAVPRQAIRTLAAANQPYRPDRAGELCPSPGVALIYRGLQVTPEDAFEQQPISLEGDKCLTWDGRLDNRHDRRRTAIPGGLHVLLVIELSLTVNALAACSRCRASWATWASTRCG